MSIDRITVNAAALRTLLQALNGPQHHILELMHTKSLHNLGHPNPIVILTEEFNAPVPAVQQAAPVAYELGDFRIARRSSAEDEQESWAVLWRGMCLSKSGNYTHEPQPSSRTEKWLAEHRFSSASEAAAAALAAQAKQGGANAE